MADISIFSYSPQKMIKMDSVTLNCNQIDNKANSSSENSSQASSCEVEIDTENKMHDCSLHVMSANDQQNKLYDNDVPDDFNDTPRIYNNNDDELNQYKCSPNSLQLNDFNSNNNSISFIPWSTEEDEIIKDFMKKDQKNSKNQIKESTQSVWARLANIPLLMNNKRTAKDIKQRWMLHLDPLAAEERLKGPWTIEEDILLAKLHDIYGNSWNKIASFIPGRTEPSVKNRWNAHLKTKLRSKLESSALSASTVISTPSNLLNSLFQNENIQNQNFSQSGNEKNQNKSKTSQSRCQYLIIDDLEGNDLSENLTLDDNSQFLYIESSKKAQDDIDDQNNSCQSIKSNVVNKEKSFLLDWKMPSQIKSPNMNSPFSFFGPWPNTYYAGV